MLLLAWLAGVATDSDDACVAAGNRYFDGNYLDGYPAMVAMRALRPALYRAVSPFLDNADPAVRDTALAAALAFAEHPALAHTETTSSTTPASSSSPTTRSGAANRPSTPCAPGDTTPPA
ncbi:hypothetical protein ACFV0O_27265 [Kitasatospora sp. NPDC059577]|uniref:hypothetical protein n=1 Tax=Kitasatospora sp. NPDC059577 TaxID=3346873 RepID=UPI0036893C30